MRPTEVWIYMMKVYAFIRLILLECPSHWFFLFDYVQQAFYDDAAILFDMFSFKINPYHPISVWRCAMF